MKRLHYAGLVLAGLSLLLCSCMNTAANRNAPTQALVAQSPEFRVEGRIDRDRQGAPVLIWQATRVAVDFEGSALALLFGDTTGQSHFDVEVDGRRQRVSVTGAGRSRKPWPLPLGPGWHTLRIFKTSDAAVGHVALTGLELETGARLRAPAAENHAVSMLFFGDSITVGACNEDGETDQWDDHSTHNNARSYGALTAAAFGADYRNLAISGMGICEGYVEILAHQAWDALYPEVGSPRAPADSWKPDLIFVNLGENDSSFSRNAGHAFPAGYTDGLVALARRIRADHPQAHIVLLRGGMWGGAKDPALLAAWEKAVACIEREDTRVSHFAFAHWSELHPRVADDEAMARELTAWLGGQPWMRGRALSSAR